MTLEGKGRVIGPSRGRVMVYIPADVHKDSQFPFGIGQEVVIRIEGQELRIYQSEEPREKNTKE